MEKMKVESKDLYSYSYPHDVNCSSDGKYAAYIMTHMDEKKDGYVHDIQVLNISSGEILELTQSKDVTAFQWISEQEILFASAREHPKAGTSDFYIISLEGGEAKKAFTIPKACSLPVSLGDGKWIVTTKNVTDAKETQEDRAVEGVDYWTFTDKPFIRNGEKFGQRRRTALEIFDEADGTLRQITPKYFETAGYDISSDKKTILYYGEEYETCNSLFQSLREYQIEDGSTKELVEGGTYQISVAKYVEEDILLQASTLTRTATQNHDIYLFHKDTRMMEKKASPDGMYTTLIDVDAVYGGGRGNKVLGDKFIGARLAGTKTEFDELDVAAGSIREIAKVDAFTSFDIANRRMYAVALENYELAEIYEIHMETGEKRKLTDFSAEYMETHLISKPEKFTFRAANGEAVDGFVIAPVEKEEGKKYPAVLFIHGGPKWAYGNMFTHVMQCMAAKGMYVMFCNPHGSDGYGDKFLEMVKEWGTVDYQHVMEFTDECLKRYPDMDENRLGVTGGSYGGYLTNWIIGHTDRFKAAVSQRSISNLVTTSLIIDIGERVLKQSCGECNAWNQEEVLWNLSPLKYVKHVVTPTLFLHSDADYRCYMGDAFQMFTALKQMGVETELYLFHGENHGLSRNGKPSNRIVRVEAMISWMEKYL